MSGSPERSKSLARRGAAQAARTWEVDLRPEEVRRLVRKAEGMTRRATANEHPMERTPHDGRVFVDVSDDEIVLWRRPGRSWLYVLRGVAERVPYPDMLRLAIEPTPHGSRVVATWEKHPLTQRSALWIASIGLIVLGCLFVTAEAPLVVLISLLAAFAIPVARFFTHRSARKDLLVAAHAALAAHERGEVEDDAYRADRRLALGEPRRRRP